MSQPPFKPPIPPKPGASAARPGAAAARPGREAEKPSFGPRLDDLENAIDDWRQRYDRFFGGDPKQRLPPEPERAKVESQLKSLRDNPQMAPADRFRLTALEARFTSLREMLGRRLREREEGPRRAPQAVAPPAPAFDARQGINFGREVRPEAVEALFSGLNRDSKEPPRFDLDSFGRYLQQQVTSIQQKTGCAEVQFRVAVEDGKVKLKARPITTS